MKLIFDRIECLFIGALLGVLLVGILSPVFGATSAQLKTTADSLRAATVTADSFYNVSLNRAGASRCSTVVQAYLDTACAEAKAKYGVLIVTNAQDSMYVKLKSEKSSEMFLITQTVQAQGLYSALVDDGTFYIALVRKDRALQGLQLMQGVATGHF